MEKPINVEKPVIEVKHSDLKRASEDSFFKSKCTACEDGVLLIYREDNGRLQEFDRCINCGQLFRYLDIKDLRKLDGVGIDNENMGS
ncbi:MAG: hypothetical protein ACFFD2_21625 [Promethearchaeota archaeon]